MNFISESYPEIPRVNVDGVFGPSTAAQVRAFKERFDLPGDPERVNAPVWNAIASVYDDLYTGGMVNTGQYSGQDIS